MANIKKAQLKKYNPLRRVALKRDSVFSKPQLVVFALAFGLIGYFIYKSFASAPAIQSLEAEQMVLPAGATVVNDIAASSAKAVKLTQTGELSGFVTLPAAADTISIHAKSQKCRGQVPGLSLMMDGSVLGTHNIRTADWSDWTLHHSLAQGLHSINLTFSASGAAKCATVLYVDAVNFYGPLADAVTKPILTFTANPTAVTAGAASTLNWDATNADKCTASGDWSGQRPAHGTASTGALSKTSTYNLVCTGQAGETKASVIVTLAPAAGQSSPPLSSRPLYGYSAHVLSQNAADNYLDLAANGGAGTIRDNFDWKTFEPDRGAMNWAPTDRLVALAARHNLRVLMVLGTTPAWARSTISGANADWQPPVNAADFGSAAGKLAARYGAQGSFWAANPSIPKMLPAGIELWNEPNNKAFWGGMEPDPAKYVSMVKSASAQIKSVDSSMPVVAGSLTAAISDSASKGYWLSYLKQMYSSGVKGHMDALSLHLFRANEGTSVNQIVYATDAAWQVMAGAIRGTMTANGDSAGVWVTGAGVPTNQVNDPVQADVAGQEMALWKSYSWSGNFYWSDLKDSCKNTNPECWLGTVRADNSLKPSYEVLKAAWSNVAQTR